MPNSTLKANYGMTHFSRMLQRKQNWVHMFMHASRVEALWTSGITFHNFALHVLNVLFMFFFFYAESVRGNHGYSNNLESMHPFFIAHGPAFKKNYFAEPFDIIDIYPLMCHILEIEPHHHNGSLSNINHILLNQEPFFSESKLVLGE